MKKQTKQLVKVKNSTGGTVYVMPSTPSDHRSLLNTVAGLRRAGVLPADYRI